METRLTSATVLYSHVCTASNGLFTPGICFACIRRTVRAGYDAGDRKNVSRIVRLSSATSQSALTHASWHGMCCVRTDFTSLVGVSTVHMETRCAGGFPGQNSDHCSSSECVRRSGCRLVEEILYRFQSVTGNYNLLFMTNPSFKTGCATDDLS